MDAVDLWLLRYESVHGFVVDELAAGLTDDQIRGRPVPGVNPVAWLMWHAMRVEDVCVNRFVLDRPQVLASGWVDRMHTGRRDVGTGMTDAQVDDLCGR
ncbi:MAG TPA: DinB family protein, partial [Methylomirabilota bacterium]